MFKISSRVLSVPGSFTGSSPVCWHSCCSWQVTLSANCSAIAHMSTILVNVIQSSWFAKISLSKNLFVLILSAYLFQTDLTPLTCHKKSASGVGFSPHCFTSKGKKQKYLLSCRFFVILSSLTTAWSCSRLFSMWVSPWQWVFYTTTWIKEEFKSSINELFLYLLYQSLIQSLLEFYFRNISLSTSICSGRLKICPQSFL